MDDNKSSQIQENIEEIIEIKKKILRISTTLIILAAGTVISE